MLEKGSNWLSDLEHDWQENHDIYNSIYPGDVVGFIYKEKLKSGLVESLVKNEEGFAIRIGIKELHDPGTVHTYNTRGGADKGAIEHIFVFKEMMPDDSITKEQLREKMFISCSGLWGNENIGGWVQKLDKTNLRDIKITLNPVMIDQLDMEDKREIGKGESFINLLPNGAVGLS